MNSYTIKGSAIQCTIKADSLEEAMRIISAPLLDVAEALKTVIFEKI